MLTPQLLKDFIVIRMEDIQLILSMSIVVFILPDLPSSFIHILWKTVPFVSVVLVSRINLTVYLTNNTTKEERYKKVDEIFAQMDKDGTLGEFFPASMNPFYFNDTAAYLIDPSFTKEEVTSKGYLRRDEPIKVDIPADAKVVQSTELDKFEGRRDDQRTIDPEILKYVIQDEQGNYYRIIPMEYKFLMKHGLPLPRKHRLERMKENFRIN